MDKTVLTFIISVIVLFSQSVYANTYHQKTRPIADEAIENYLQSYTIFIPAGATVNAVLSQEINSNTAVVGQTISAILTEDFKYKNTLIATAGSIILGNIVYNKKAGIAGKSAQMQIRFTTIRTPYNNIIPVSAVINTEDATGILKPETTNKFSKTDIKNAQTKKPNTSFSGGIGLAKAVATKGDNILIPSESIISLLFEQPITLGAP